MTAMATDPHCVHGFTFGVERSCASCGEPVMVDRDQIAQRVVFCGRCERHPENRMQQFQARTDGAA